MGTLSKFNRVCETTLKGNLMCTLEFTRYTLTALRGKLCVSTL